MGERRRAGGTCIFTERGGGDIPGAHDLYKVTYIRHLKSKGLSVTMLTQKRNGLFMTKIRVFCENGVFQVVA